ncbi:MAG: response regulator transcription factor [Chloroflexi bacterium]|nr:response regulator transcription factor [Chloroflexota bacterium]
MKALIIEDAPDVVETIRLCFNIRWPDAVLTASATGAKALEMLAKNPPDLVVLDLGLPDMDGLDLLREIRNGSDVPVIIVTARNDETTRVRGLEAGADDYIEKPFPHTELLARVKAVLRRTRLPELWGETAVRTGRGLLIDMAGHRLLVNGKEVNLTPTEWSLLAQLVRHRGKVVVHQALADQVWGTSHLDTGVIKMTVRRLRLKLGDDPKRPRIIRSHRGLGYSLVIS